MRGDCRHGDSALKRAKSARSHGLRAEVYTRRRPRLSTGAGPCTTAVRRGDGSPHGALNCPDADHGGGGGPGRLRGGGLRGCGTRRRGEAALAAAAGGPGGDPVLRRPVPELAARSPRGRPVRRNRAAGLPGRRGHGGVRRAAGRPAGGVGGTPGRAAHQLRTGELRGCARAAGRRVEPAGPAGGRPPGLPAAGLPALPSTGAASPPLPR